MSPVQLRYPLTHFALINRLSGTIIMVLNRSRQIRFGHCVSHGFWDPYRVENFASKPNLKVVPINRAAAMRLGMIWSGLLTVIPTYKW